MAESAKGPRFEFHMPQLWRECPISASWPDGEHFTITWDCSYFSDCTDTSKQALSTQNEFKVNIISETERCQMVSCTSTVPLGLTGSTTETIFLTKMWCHETDRSCVE